MIKISQWWENHGRTNTSLARKKEIQKSRAARVTVLDLSRKVNHLSEFEIHQVLSVSPEYVSQLASCCKHN